MIIDLNSGQFWNFSAKNRDFSDLVEVCLHPQHTIAPTASAVKIVFDGCRFRLGCILQFDISATPFTLIEIQFLNCLIPGEQLVHTIQKNEQQQVDIFLFGCILGNFQFEKSSISSIYVGRTILPKSVFRINDSNVPRIHFQNCLGDFFINDTGNAEVVIDFSDGNLHVTPGARINAVYKQIARDLGLHNVLGIKSSFHITDVKKIRYVSGGLAKNQGLVRETVPGLHGSRQRWNYHPTTEDLDRLEVSLAVYQSKAVTQSIYISGAVLSTLGMKGISGSVVTVEHLACQRIYIDDFSAKEFLFYDIRSRFFSDALFSLSNCRLGPAQLTRVYLNSYEVVNFYRDFLEDVRFAGVQFPRVIHSVENIHYLDRKENNYGEMQYELYRQLKVALIKNYNQVQALDMHQRMFNAIRKHSFLSKEDRFILCLNRLSNNHETSIGIATIKWTVG